MIDPFDESQNLEELPTKEFWLGAADRFNDFREFAWDITVKGDRSAQRWIEAPEGLRQAKIGALARFRAALSRENPDLEEPSLSIFDYCLVEAWITRCEDVVYMLGASEQSIADPAESQLKCMLTLLMSSPPPSEFEDDLMGRAKWNLECLLSKPVLN